VQDTDYYEFLLTNKKCIVNAEVFRTILDIYPRVESVDSTDVPVDDIALTFLIDLGYMGPLNRHTNMFVDHMHQPRRTLAAIINKFLLRKLAEIAYQIDHKKEKRSRRKNMPYPRFTIIIINHFLKQHKSLTNLNHKHYHTIKDDGIVSRLKFVRIGKDYEEYGLLIPDVMLTDAIKRSESYQMFIKYSTHHIPPKKSRGKGSLGEKTSDTPVEEVEVSEEYDPKPAKKKTSSKRRVKKKVMIFADDNIISDDPDAALELAKLISQTEAEETEAAKKLGKVTFDPPKKLKGVPSLTPIEQEAVDIMQDFKKRKKSSKSQPGTGGSDEGTGVPDEEKGITKEKVILEWGDEDNDNDNVEKDDKDGDADDEGDDHVNDTQDAHDEDVKTEFVEDEIYKYKIRVRKDKDEEMENDKVEESDKRDEEATDAAKEDAKKTLEVKDDTKKTEIPPTSSSLSVSLVELRVAKLEKDVSEMKTVDHSTEALTVLKSQVPMVIDSNLNTKVRDVFQKELQKHTTYLIHKYSLRHLPELTKKSTLTAEQEYEKNENAMDKGVVDTVKDHKKKHDDDDEGPSTGPNQGKMSKRRITKESGSSKKPSTTKDTPKGKTSTKGSKTGKSATISLIGIPEGNRYPFDLSKPLPLHGPPGHQTVAADYFFNNDLDYLKTSDPEVTYITSIAKTKATQYEIKGIKDMVPTLWSTIKHAYDKDEILGVKSVSVKKLHGYGHLEEIVVRRSDQQLYKFKECDFVDLHLNDIEDITTEDLSQNQMQRTYTPSYDPPGVVYKDLNKQNRVMQANDLYKFSNETLKSVRDELHHSVFDFCLDCNKEMPRRKWTVVDRRSSGLMIELIKKQLREKEIIRNLERLVGARELKMDYKLMTRTI
nr:hypothetical protein [Tanacetum cinerariifolium]